MPGGAGGRRNAPRTERLVLRFDLLQRLFGRLLALAARAADRLDCLGLGRGRLGLRIVGLDHHQTGTLEQLARVDRSRGGRWRAHGCGRWRCGSRLGSRRRYRCRSRSRSGGLCHGLFTLRHGLECRRGRRGVVPHLLGRRCLCDACVVRDCRDNRIGLLAFALLAGLAIAVAAATAAAAAATRLFAFTRRALFTRDAILARLARFVVAAFALRAAFAVMTSTTLGAAVAATRLVLAVATRLSVAAFAAALLAFASIATFTAAFASSFSTSTSMVAALLVVTRRTIAAGFAARRAVAVGRG